MNGKKRHEVQIMAALIDHLLSSMEGADDEKHAILDLGAGQGYLDGVLAYEYGRVVVGVDDDTIQTCGAKRRSERIGRLYEKRGEGKGALYHVNRRVEVGESFARMLREVKTEVGAAADGREIAGEEGERWALCGLHTCGDLASASIEHFLASDAGLLVNVGCCYNRLSEDVDPSSVPEWESSKDKDHRVRAEKGRGFGYPLSRLFNAERETYHLGFTARTLGCQATSRWVPSTTATEAQTDSAAPSTSTSTSPADNPRDAYRRHFYRALLQHVIVSRGLMPLVGKRRRNPDGSVSVLGSDDAAGGEGGDGASGDNGDALIIGRMKPHVFSRGFARYARIALGRLGVDAEACGLSESDLTAYEAVFAGREKEIAVVWTLRAMMGSAIESLVLVDRVLYLRERGGEGKVKVELFPLFGLRDSPRNMVLVARKVLPGEKGDAVEGSRGVGDDASIIE
ncbi:hypothetical protein HK101_010849 [Irineochytrium annulatum]|nr:hypothetical protein HK101_010849 [Irineochytrium annulatum]